MINDTGNEQPKPTQSEVQPKERVIELNEWFTPFHNYDELEYLTEPEYKDWWRAKSTVVELKGVDKFQISLGWNQAKHDLWKKNEPRGDHLLVLPNGEKILKPSDIVDEQKKTESRFMHFGVSSDSWSEWRGKEMPFGVELELPSGTIITAPFVTEKNLSNGQSSAWPDVDGHWTITGSGEKFMRPIIPELENIIDRLKLRFVPKE